MTPTLEEIRATYTLLSERFRLSPRVSDAAIRVALAEAEQLAADPFDLPAALLYCFARHARAFPGGFRTMTALLVEAQCARSGQHFTDSRLVLGAWVSRVAAGTASFEEVQAWMGQHLLPLGESGLS